MAGIFRAYDIRGVYPSQVNEEVFFKIAVAYANYMKHARKVVVGRDARLSSPKLSNAVVHGLRAAGKDVVDIGVVPTPVLYFSMFRLKTKAGLMITASHLPKQYNGIKLEKDHAMGLTGEKGIYKIEEWVKSDRLNVSKKHGPFKKIDVDNDYIKYITKKIRLKRPLKVVIDSGNGVCGDIAEKAFKKLGCKVTSIYKNPDGRFPNHIADPHEYSKYHSLTALKRKVKQKKADLGIAYDADGDRVGFVDDKGRRIGEEHSILLLAKQALRNSRGRKIIVDVRASDKLIKELKRLGSIVEISRAGHSYIAMRTSKERAIFAGETSGHLFFPYCYFPYDDAIFGSLKFAEIASMFGNISYVVDSLPRQYISHEIRLRYPDEQKFKLIKELKKYLRKKGYHFSTIDGAKIRFKNGWALVRASNTAPQITIRYEGDTKKDFIEVRNRLKAILGRFGLRLGCSA